MGSLYSKEILRRIGDYKVSDIGLGSWDVKNPKRFVETLVEAFRNGINLVDTAEMYGTEPYVGEAIRIYGGEIFVTTKLYPSSLDDEDRAIKAAKRQVERLGKVPELLLLHWPVDLEREVRNLEKVAEAGLAKMIGLSNVSKEEIERANVVLRKYEVVAVQNRYSYHSRGVEYMLKYLEEKGIALQAYTPIERGKVKEDKKLQEVASKLGHSPIAVALAWLLHRSPIVIPIPKTERKEHLREILEALEVKLPEWALRELS